MAPAYISSTSRGCSSIDARRLRSTGRDLPGETVEHEHDGRDFLELVFDGISVNERDVPAALARLKYRSTFRDAISWSGRENLAPTIRRNGKSDATKKPDLCRIRGR
jgi:hypothetical protein